LGVRYSVSVFRLMKIRSGGLHVTVAAGLPQDPGDADTRLPF